MTGAGMPTAAAEAEKYVIGAALMHPDGLREVIEHITGDDFNDRRLGAAYNVMVGMRGTGEPIEALSVLNALHERSVRLTLPDLHDCISTATTWTNAGYYAKQVADAAGKRRLYQFATQAAQLSQGDAPFNELMADARRAWEQVQTFSVGGIEARPLADILDGPDDYDWIVPNLLERRDRVIFTGGEGAGKSFLIQQIAILSAAGIHPTTFQPIEPVKVLVVDAENSEKQWRRRVRPLVIKARQEGAADPAQTLYVAPVPRLNLTDERDLSAVHRLMDEHQPDLLMIGPLYRLIPRAIQSDDDAAPLIAALDGLRARGAALVMEAHAGHEKNGAGERNLRPRGSSALLGWPEFGLGLALDGVGPDGKALAKLVRWRGDRDQRAWPNRLRRDSRWPWVDDEPHMTAMSYEDARLTS